MSPTASPSSSTDRNLLIGVLALQMDFISRDQLVAAMNAWVLDKAQSLDGILEAQAALNGEERRLLSALVAKHLERHQGDATRSLAAIGPLGSDLEPLRGMGDADLDASLAYLPHEESTGPFVGRNGDALRGPRFRIVRDHAEGGLGKVSVAIDVELNREVALKEIKEKHAHRPESRARFVLEAEITGGLEHPGIVPVYSLGTADDGRPYYAMRFIRGDSLKEAIAQFHEHKNAMQPGERTVALRQLLGRFVDVCNAIAYAHSRGVLHRDLKPANVMLGPYGETLVVDWGLAKALEKGDVPPSVRTEAPLRPASASGSDSTVAGTALGTPQYMSPEQAAGRLDLVGPASDIYGLGATLFSLLTGHAPFEVSKDSQTPRGDLGELLKRVMGGAFPRPREVEPSVSRALEAVCVKAMALEAKDRYPSARALAEDVEHWLAGEPVTAWREPWAVRARRWVGRHRTLVTSAAAVLLVALAALAALSAVLTASNEQQRQARQEAEHARDQAEAERNEADRLRHAAEEQERRAEVQLYASRLELARNAWENGGVGRARDHMTACPEHLRGWEHDYLWSLFNSGYRVLPGHTEAITVVAFAPDGTMLASGSDDATVRIWESPSGSPVQTLKGHRARIIGLAWSPDGGRLATASTDATIRVWNPRTGEEQFVIRQPALAPSTLAWSPDGAWLAAGLLSDGRIPLWDAKTGEPAGSLAGHPGGTSALAWGPDGKMLASAGADSLKLWDVAARKETKAAKLGGTQSVFRMAFRPGGSQLVCFGKPTIAVWNLATGELAPGNGALDAGSGALSGDGRQAAVFFSTRVRFGDPVAEGVQYTWKAPPFDDNFRCFAWSPGVGDAAVLATGCERGTLCLWRNAPQQEPVLRGHAGAVSAVAVSPDGRRIASASHDQTVRIWDPESGRHLRSLAADARPLNVAYRPDGGQVAASYADHAVRLWDPETGVAEGVLKTGTGERGSLWGVAYSPDGRRVAAGNVNGKLLVWDTASGTLVAEQKLHSGGVMAVAWSPDGGRIATASDDQSLRVVAADDGRELLRMAGHGGGVKAVAWSPDGRRLASASFDTTLRVWDAETGSELTRMDTGHYQLKKVAWSADGRRVIGVGLAQAAQVWDAATGLKLLDLPAKGGTIDGVSLSGDGRRLVTASAGRLMQVWNADQSLSRAERPRESLGTKRACWCGDGKWLARFSDAELTPDEPSRLNVVAPETGAVVMTWRGRTATIQRLAADPDGGRLAGSFTDGTIRVWTVATGECFEFRAHDGPALDVAFSPDGKTLATASWDQSVRLWDPATGRRIAELRGHRGPVYAVVFHPNCSLVASGSDDRTVRLWDVATGKVRHELTGFPTTVLHVNFSSDGGRLAVSCGPDGRTRAAVHLFDVAAEPVKLRVIEGPFGNRSDAGWMPGEPAVAVPGRPTINDCQIVDAISGEVRHTFHGRLSQNGDEIKWAQFRPGRRQVLLSGDGDGFVRLWDLDTGGEIRVPPFEK